MIKLFNSVGPNQTSNKSNEELFETHAKTYSDDIDQAVSFSLQNTNFFSKVKADYLLKLIRENIGEARGLKLLDVGCGTGVLHKYLVGSGLNISGVDIANAPLELANITNPEVQYTKFDGEALPFEKNTFDITIAVCVFHHIPVIERGALIAEMKRVTRHGGIFCIIEHNPLNILTRLAVWRCPFDKEAILLTPRYSLNLIKASGPDVKAMGAFYFLFFPINFDWLRKVESHLTWLFLGAQYCTYGIKNEL